MAFAGFPNQQDVVRLLQRSLEHGRLAHAYLFGGPDLVELEAMARTLAKTLDCERPPRRSAGKLGLDCCDACPSCRKIDNETHPDVLWVRPESKSRVITIEQMRDLMQTVHLKPAQAAQKVAVIVAADRLNMQAANAFLKTLEEPPADSILILLSTQPQSLLETLRSRCLRLNFTGESTHYQQSGFVSWLASFSQMAGSERRSLLARYRLLSVLLNRLNSLKAELSEALTRRSPLERYEDIDPKTRERWEDELAAAIEAEYRRQRAELLTGVQWWLRDVWLETLQLGGRRLTFPQLSADTQAVAQRLSSEQAIENLERIDQTQRLLGTNVQEALALEVGLLKLHL